MSKKVAIFASLFYFKPTSAYLQADARQNRHRADGNDGEARRSGVRRAGGPPPRTFAAPCLQPAARPRSSRRRSSGDFHPRVDEPTRAATTRTTPSPHGSTPSAAAVATTSCAATAACATPCHCPNHPSKPTPWRPRNWLNCCEPPWHRSRRSSASSTNCVRLKGSTQKRLPTPPGRASSR